MGKASRKKEHQAQKISHQGALAPGLKGPLIQPWIVFLLLLLLSVLIYSNTFSASFHFDDVYNIGDNPWIKNFSNFLDLSGNRYVGYLSFALNYHFGQLDVFGYHLVNLFIHITNGFLVYLLVRLFFSTPRMQSSDLHTSQSSWIALATALLFVAHPIQTQAVTYIVQRFTSLATLFYLLAVVLYLQWRLAAPESRHRSLYYAGALLSTILAMKTKEITFTLPFMLLLIEAVFFGSLTRRQWIAQIPFLLTLLIIPLSHTGAIGEAEGFVRETTETSRSDYLFTQFRVIMTYLRLLIFPAHQNLDYDYPISHSLLEPKVLFSFLFLLVLFSFSLYLLFVRSRTADSSRFSVSSSRLVGFGILWFFLTLSIESSIIPIRDVIFEHRLYLPSVGLLLAGSVMILTLLDRWRGMSVVAISILVVILSIVTYQRNLIWKDDLTLWTDMVQKSPLKARVHNNLGVVYRKLGRLDEAIQEYEAAITLKSDFVDAHNNLGNVYEALGHADKAIQEYKTALTLNPDYTRAHYNLGTVYQDMEHLDEAIQEYKSALTLEPNYAEAHNNLGLVYQKLGRFDEAIQEYRTVSRLEPDYAEAHNNLGLVYQKLGRFDEAIQEYKSALTLKPSDADFHINLGVVYQNLERFQEAIREYEAAITLRQDLAHPHNNLGLVYQKLGRFDEAIREYKAALTLEPNDVEAHNNLGLVYQKLGRFDEAIQEYKSALALKPGDANFHNNLGVVYQNLERLQEAIREYEAAITLNPDLAHPHKNLGLVYQKQGRLGEAIREYAAAIILNPDYAEAHYSLGQAYQRKGQIQEATHEFEQALQIKPDYELARQALKSLRR